MESTFAPVDKAGRIVLPKKIRDELDLSPGDILSISVHGAEVTLRPQKGSPGFVRKGQALVFSVKSQAVLREETVNQIINEERERGVGSIAAGLGSRKRHK
jgi:AbrB family looped-hinge helix DNA binding protein